MWVKVGIALKDTGSPTGFGLWNEWSQKSSKYDPGDMDKRWATFRPNGDITIATIFFEAQKIGWIHSGSQIAHEEIKITEKNLVIIDKYKRQAFPENLLRPPGFVGEFADFIEFRSIRSQPIFALSGALAATGVLLGQKIRSQTDVRTNLYALNVGPPGCGKDAARSIIKRCFSEIGASGLLKIEELASEAAINTAIGNDPASGSQLMLLDEIGRFLQTTNSSKNNHLFNIVSVLLKLYSNANIKYFGKSYADAEKQIQVDQPNVCILGTTTPDTLYQGLTTNSINDGLLSRMVIFETETPNPRKKRLREISKSIVKTPQSLLDQMSKMYYKPRNVSPKGNLDAEVDPQIVLINDRAEQMFEDFEDHIFDVQNKLLEQEKPHAVYSRTTQIAQQISLIVAGGVNIDEPVITENEAQYGIELANYLSNHVMHIAENFIADNEREHALKKILTMIRQNGKITLTKITRATQKLSRLERKDILETLKQSGQVVETIEMTNNGRNVTYFVAAELAEQGEMH
jgi:hypothetical protein